MKANRSDYTDFIDKYLTKKRNRTGTDFADKITVGFGNQSNTVIPPSNIWSMPTDTDRSGVINDIAKKFITKKGKLDKFYKVDDTGPNAFSAYGVTPYYRNKNVNSPIDTETYLQLDQLPAKFSTLSHELVHANDHQFDNLNEKVWNELKNLYTKQNNLSTQSVTKIQNKIDPSKDFSKFYHMNKKEYDKTKNQANSMYNLALLDYANGNKKQSHWTNNNFNEIDKVLNYTKNNKKNPYFLATMGSEFPAFMSENITQHWKTDTGINNDALNKNEQEFLHKTLGHMDTAYSQNDYPTFNKFIKERSRSIESTPTWIGNTQANPILERPKSVVKTQSPVNPIVKKRSLRSKI